ncbi:hypothetical protein [Methylobacterium sp.]|uniref:hypothetical protein n=1 Tax=Methylobacterium sp. TaxID=409 RepID=UPI003B0113AB
MRQIKAERPAPGASRRARKSGTEVPECSRQLGITGRINAGILNDAVLQGRGALLGIGSQHRIVVLCPCIAKLPEHEVRLDVASLNLRA